MSAHQPRGEAANVRQLHRRVPGYDDPLDLVDRTDLPYEERLALLQEWQAGAAASDQPEARQEAILAAIHALEMGAEVQDDAPEQAPEHHGYGKGERSGA